MVTYVPKVARLLFLHLNSSLDEAIHYIAKQALASLHFQTTAFGSFLTYRSIYGNKNTENFLKESANSFTNGSAAYSKPNIQHGRG